MSVGDIYDAYEEEEAAAQRVMPSLSSHSQKRPMPTPRSDLEKAPAEPAPPLPGASASQNRKPGEKTSYNKLLEARLNLFDKCPTNVGQTSNKSWRSVQTFSTRNYIDLH